MPTCGFFCLILEYIFLRCIPFLFVWTYNKCVENMNDSLKLEIAKLKRQVQYKNADNDVIEKIAQKNVVLQDLVESGNFIDEAEKKLAKKMFEAYLEQNSFENYSDLSTLSVLVYNEVLSGRVQKSINDSTDSKGKAYISDKLLKSHSDLTNQILHLKTKLGIDKEVKTDEFTALQLLKKRFHNWLQENRNECTIAIPFTCSSCGKNDVKMVLLRKRIKDWDVIDHPHFLGRFWYNKDAMDLVKSGVLSKENYAKIFATSVDMVNWALANEGKIILNQDEKK